MQTILDTLKAFQDENIWWAPEQFQDIQDTRIRDGVRKAFHKPSEYLSNLTTRGTVEDMNAFEAALTDHVYLMKIAALAGLLDLLYKLDQNQTDVSRGLVQWYRQKGWKFPPFRFEQVQDQTSEDLKKIESE
jgi:hypothetical protein